MVERTVRGLPFISNNSSSVDSTLFDLNFDPMFGNCVLSEEDLSKEVMEFEQFLNSCDTSVGQKPNQMSIIPVVRPIATYNKGLNDLELNKLEELWTATKCLQFLDSPTTQHIIEFSKNGRIL